jgi:hypothetical protein
MYFCRKEGKYSAVRFALMAAGKKIPAKPAGINFTALAQKSFMYPAEWI